MTIEIIALLDKPSPTAFCMVPFVARNRDDPGKTLRVHGLRDHAGSRLEHDELEDLVRGGSALRLDDPVQVSIDAPGLVAGWLGERFQRRMLQLRGVMLPLRPLYRIPSHGGFWLAAPDVIYGLLDQWTREAATDVFTGLAGPEMAELMLWVLHERDETRAAVWHTRATPAEKARHLEWYARLEHDAGRPISEQELEERFLGIAEKFATPVRSALKRFGRNPPKAAPFFTNHSYSSTVS